MITTTPAKMTLVTTGIDLNAEERSVIWDMYICIRFFQGDCVSMYSIYMMTYTCTFYTYLPAISLSNMIPYPFDPTHTYHAILHSPFTSMESPQLPEPDLILIKPFTLVFVLDLKSKKVNFALRLKATESTPKFQLITYMVGIARSEKERLLSWSVRRLSQMQAE